MEVGNARDFLSIPHEIGHYVYRHGSSDGSRLQYALNEALLGQPAWLHNWAEEIFADVYGVLIAGPVMVRDFQDIVKDNDLPSLLNDDNTHPMPVLRPLLYVDALKLLASKLDKTAEGDELREQAEELGKPPDDLIRPADALQHIADEAEDRWTKYRGSRGQAHIDERRGIIEQAVKTAFDILSKGQLVPINDLWSRPNLDSALTRADKYEKLYNDFYEDVAGKPGGLLERLRKTAVPDSQVGWATPLQTLPTLQWLEQIRNTATNGNAPPGRFPPEVWTLVVSMAGWATNGPESNPSPKVT